MARSLNRQNWGYGPFVTLHTAAEVAAMRSDDSTPSPVFTNGESFTVTATAIQQADGTLVELGPAVARFLHHDAPLNSETAAAIPWMFDQLPSYRPVVWVSEPSLALSSSDSHIVEWPSTGYACDLCWSVQRWPWEPTRACPWNVDPASTLCARHKTHVSTGLTH